MAGIRHLKQVRDKKGKDFLNNLLNNFVIINEQVNGTFFGVKKDQTSDKFKYYKKSGEITYVDRMLMKYYNPAIAYFETLPPEKLERIPSNFYFGFEFLSKRDGKSSSFDKMPKNNLVLLYIHRLGEDGKPIETLQTKDDLDKWAYYLGVEAPPIIFEGMLDEEQKASILEFVYNSEDELMDKFKSTSFTKYIMTILDADAKDSFLKKGLGGDIDGVIFRFYDENEENPKADVFLAKLVDPIFKEKAKEKDADKPEKKSNDYIWLIVIDLMNHIEMYSYDDLAKMTKDQEDYDRKYIALVNQIFKDFISEYSNKYEGLQLDVPEYLKRPEFEINYELINDSQVETIIKNNETYTEIYRILTNFFRKVRKKSSSSFFSPELLNQLNIQVKKIKRVIMGDAVYEGLFPSFGEYIGDSVNDNMYIGEHEHFTNSKKNGKAEKVNVLIGNFQPVHNGHIKAAQKLKDNNGLECVFISVMKPNKKYPFSERTSRILLEKTQQANSDLIKDFRIVKSDSIKAIVAAIRPQFNPVLWGSSNNKMRDYVLQLDYIKKKDVPLRISDEFKLIEIPSYQKSSEVIDAIINGDYVTFKKIVPSIIGSEFFNLQKELELTSN